MQNRLKQYSREKLIILARELKIKNCNSLKKDQLLTKILATDHSQLKAILKINWWNKYSADVFGWCTVLSLILAIVFFFIGTDFNKIKKNRIFEEEIGRLERKLQESNYTLEQQEILINEIINKFKITEEILKKCHIKNKNYQEVLIAFRNGNFKKSEEILLKQRLEEKRIEVENAKTAYILGNIRFVQLKFLLALEAYSEAIALDPGNPLYLSKAGNLYFVFGQYQQAISFFEKALQINLQKLGKNHPDVATVWNDIGNALDSLGKHVEAINCYKKALQIDLQKFGASHPNVARDWNSLGLAWRNLNSYDKAIEYFEKALRSDLKNFGEHDHNVAKDRNNLGISWRKKGDQRKVKDDYYNSLEYLEKALKSDLRKFGDKHPKVAMRWNNIGNVWASLGETEKAIIFLEKALQSDLNNFPKMHPSIIRDLNNIGFTWATSGNYEEAIKHYEEALQNSSTSVDINNPLILKLKENIVTAYMVLGEREIKLDNICKAIKHVQNAKSVFKRFGYKPHEMTKVDFILKNLKLMKSIKGGYPVEYEHLFEPCEGDLGSNLDL